MPGELVKIVPPDGPAGKERVREVLVLHHLCGTFRDIESGVIHVAALCGGVACVHVLAPAWVSPRVAAAFAACAGLFLGAATAAGATAWRLRLRRERLLGRLPGSATMKR